jgi:hypothetical protein
VGLVATIVVYALLPTTPPAPRGVSLSIAAPLAGATVTSPVVLRVCAGGFSVPGAGRLLSISIDGRQVAEVNTGTAAINVDTGEHSLRVELVTSTHREYAPPVLTDETITVSGVEPLSQPPDCPPVANSTPSADEWGDGGADSGSLEIVGGLGLYDAARLRTTGDQHPDPVRNLQRVAGKPLSEHLGVISVETTHGLASR